MALRGLNDNRNIVAKGCQDHDQARLRVTIDVAAQDSGDVPLADAGARSIPADESDNVDLPEILRFDDDADDVYQIEFNSSFRRIGVTAIFQEIAAAADRWRIPQWIFPPILATRTLTCP